MEPGVLTVLGRSIGRLWCAVKGSQHENSCPRWRTNVEYLGSSLCFHHGVIHGGLLATLTDEAFARCCAPVLTNNIGVTASLTLNYNAPVHIGQYNALRMEIVKVKGR